MRINRSIFTNQSESVPISRIITINGVSYDLSADRTWTVGGGGGGTVTSIDMSVPTGFSISGNPITSSGTLALAFASGYSLPTTIKQGNWDDAYTFVSNFPTQTGNSGKYLTTNGSTLSWGTISTHDPVTIGTANGLSIIGQVLSLSLASSSSNGALSSTDWNTFNNKQSALTNPVTGTGTLNYVAKFTGSTTVGNSQIFDNGTSVGIGTASPSASYRLTISGSTYQVGTDSKIYVDNGGVGGASAIIGVVGTSYGYLSTDGPFPFVFQTNNTERMRITSGGNVGIGTTSPASLSGFTVFSVNGSSSGSVVQLQYQGTDGLQSYSASTESGIYEKRNLYLAFGTNNTERMRITSGGNLLVGTTTDSGQKLVVNGTIGTGDITALSGNKTLTIDNITNYGQSLVLNAAGSLPMYLQNNGSTAVTITGGNVGIGTTSPGSKLHVVGATVIDDGTNGRLTFENASGQNDIYSTTTNFGAYKDLRYTASAHIFRGGSTETMRLTSGGNLIIGDTTDTGYRLFVNGNTYLKGSGNTSSNFALVVQNSSATNLFLVRNDGEATFSSSVTATSLALSNSAGGTLSVAGNTVGNGIVSITKNSTYNNEGSAAIAINSTNSLSSTELLIGADNTNNIAYLQTAAYGTSWTSKSLSLQPNGGNVGIGTTSPSEKLTVFGNILASGSSGEYPRFISTVGAKSWEIGYRSGTTNYEIREDGTTRLVIANGGNVGIGTTSPSQKLEVAGNEASSSKINSVGTVYGAGSFLNAFTNAGGNDIGFAGFIASQSNQVNRFYAGVHSPSGVNQAFIGTPEANPLTFWTSATERMRITSGGNVLIGTTTDAGYMLNVNGAAGISGQTVVTSDSVEQIIIRRSTNTNQQLLLGRYTGYSYLQSVTQGTGYDPLSINPNGGNVGIGTTSPKRQLDISSTGSPEIVLGALNGAADQKYWRVYSASDIFRIGYVNDAFTAGTDVISANRSGNVGIGTTSPETPLQIDRTNAGSYTGLFIRNTASSTLSNSSDIWFGSWAGASTSNIYNARISALNVNAGNAATDLLFYTYSGSGSSAGVLERMRITSGGNLLVGTTTDPFAFFTKNLSVVSNATNSYAALEAYGNGIGGGAVCLGNTSIIRAKIVAENGSYLSFQTNSTNTGSGTTERMRITSGGNILINTSTDTGDRLNINGTIKAGNLLGTSYIPSFTNVSNCQNFSLSVATYIRVGDVVMVMIGLSMNVITANTDSIFKVTLPASTATTSQFYVGNGSYMGNSGSGNFDKSLYVNITSSTEATIYFYPNTTNSANVSITIQYKMN